VFRQYVRYERGMSSKQVKEVLYEPDILLTVREGFWNMRDSCVKTA